MTDLVASFYLWLLIIVTFVFSIGFFVGWIVWG